MSGGAAHVQAPRPAVGARVDVRRRVEQRVQREHPQGRCPVAREVQRPVQPLVQRARQLFGRFPGRDVRFALALDEAAHLAAEGFVFGGIER